MAEKRTRKNAIAPQSRVAAPVAKAEAAPAPAKSAAPKPVADKVVPPVAKADKVIPPVLESVAKPTADVVVAAAEPAIETVEAIPAAVEEATAALVEFAEQAPAAAATADIELPITPEPAMFFMANPLLKGMMKMATAPGTTADRFQSMFSFGDVSERAKAAMEKSSKFAEELTELTKGNVEAFVASGRVAAKGAEAMTQEVADYGKKSFETATATFKSFAGVKSPTELFQLQSEYARSSFDAVVAEASKVSESMLKLMGEIAQPLSTRYAVAAEKIKTAAL